MTKPRWMMAAAAALLAFCPLVNVAGEGSAVEVSIAYLGSKDDPAWTGSLQGLDEANMQGQFLGQAFKLVASPDLSAALALKPAAVLVAADAGTFLAALKALPATAVIDLTLDDDNLRSTCIANALHIQPSQAMKKDAVAQWTRVHPGSSAIASAWRADAEKYSAIQLNERFTAGFKRPMDDHAWAGWIAVKMLADTALRLQSADPARLLDFLRTQLSFDGQKGVNMNFRHNGQLRQPLMIAEQGKLVGEAPVKGAGVGPDDLDSLGNIGCLQ